MIKIWGKNEESGTLAHPGLWGWLRPCLQLVSHMGLAPQFHLAGNGLFWKLMAPLVKDEHISVLTKLEIHRLKSCLKKKGNSTKCTQNWEFSFIVAEQNFFGEFQQNYATFHHLQPKNMIIVFEFPVKTNKKKKKVDEIFLITRSTLGLCHYFLKWPNLFSI